MAADRGQLTLLMMLDLSAVFDTVDHAILLARLNTSFGLSDTALKWFNSYLQNRSQVVFSGGVLSNVSSLACGVPQGSVALVLFFSYYILLIFYSLLREMASMVICMWMTLKPMCMSAQMK